MKEENIDEAGRSVERYKKAGTQKLFGKTYNRCVKAGYEAEGEKLDEKRDGKSAKDSGYSLRDWFKGGGWVQAGGKYDGKPCARQPGQKTKPFCRDADDRASMSKDERERRAKKKRREDPNPDRKGKAKNVTENQSAIDRRNQEIQRKQIQLIAKRLRSRERWHKWIRNHLLMMNYH